MGDPLKLLREYALGGKPIREKDGLIIFGDLAFEKNVKTNFKVYGKTNEYYDLESLYFFYQRSGLIHTAYVKDAASKQIQAVTRPDRKDLNQYLSVPEAKPPASIDLTAPVPVPMHLSRSSLGASGAGGSGAALEPSVSRPSADPAASAKERERLERILDSSLRPAVAADAAAIRPLSDALTADKIKELKTKALTRKRVQITATAEEDVPLGPAASVEQEPSGKGRERVWRTRTTCLEASAKNFVKSVFPILQSLRHREEGRAKAQTEVKQEPVSAAAAPPLSAAAGHKRGAPTEAYNRYAQDKYRKEETAGFQIDTVGTFHGMTLKSVTEGASKKTPSLPSETPSAIPGSAPKKRLSRTPIIVIPATTNSLITMYNAKEILGELRFVSTEEKRAQGTTRANEVVIARQKGGVSVPYRVVDNPVKLNAEEWERVVGVFVQFKGWPWGGNPVEIFTRMAAFHLKWEEAKLDANVAKWNVHVFALSRARRHLDRASLLRLWEILDKSLSFRIL